MGHLLYLSWYTYCLIRNRKERCSREDRIQGTCTHFIAAYLPISLTTAIAMAESDASVSDYDSESSLSDSLGTKTLQARSMVPGSFREPPETDSRKNLI